MRINEAIMFGPTRRRVSFSNLMALGNLNSTRLIHLPCSSPCVFARPCSSLSASNAQQQRSFMVDYLVNSVGLSIERAVALEQLYGPKLRFHSPDKPDSTIAFLRTHGFDNIQIARMVSCDPRLLISYSDKVLLRKFDFFYSIGFTKEDLPKFVSSQRRFWSGSLDGWIIPLCEMLKDVLGSEREMVVALKRFGFGRRFLYYKNVNENVAILKECGVSSSKIAYLLRTSPYNLLAKPDEFRRIVDEVKALGFDVSKYTFVCAINALEYRYRTTRERCSAIYKEWGFTENDIESAFRKWPQCLMLSDKKLRGTLEFLFKQMGCQVEAVARSPKIFTLDLERRIIPRCSVVHVLVQKGLLKKDWSLYSVLPLSEERFLGRYINKYQDVAPELMSVYLGKVDPFKEMHSQKCD